MSQTTFSVIIPIYNVENYLRECLDSIIHQSFKDFEVICINDGSTDSSLSILEDFAKKDNRIKIYTQKNQGQGIARNNALEKATGKYVIFVDPDDWIEKSALELIKQKFEETNAQIVQYNYLTHNEYSKQAKKCSLQEELKKKYYNINLQETPIYCWQDFKKHILNYALRFMVWDKAYTLDLIKVNNIKCAPNKHAEDNIFAISAVINAAKIAYLDKYLYIYRCRPNSAVNKKSDEIFCIFDNIKLLKDFLLKKDLFVELQKGFSQYIIDICAWHYPLIPEKSLNSYLEKCKSILTPKEYKTFERKITTKNKTFPERIFSIKNRVENAIKYKVVTILDLEFIIKNK